MRRALIRHIMPIVDSVGVNERETVDLLEAMKYARLASDCTQNPSAKICSALWLKLSKNRMPAYPASHVRSLYHPAKPQFSDLAFGKPQRHDSCSGCGGSKAETGRLSEYEDLTVAPVKRFCDEGIKRLGRNRLTDR